MNFLPGWNPAFITGARLTTITQVLSADAETESITAPSGIQAGDLIVLFDAASTGYGSAPTAVTPSGFTNIINTSGAVSGFAGWRMMLSYKLAVGTEGSSSITGMIGDGLTGKCLLVFRGNKPATLITTADPEGEATDGNPTAKTVGAASGVVPLIVIGGYVSVSGTVSPRTFSPAKDGEINTDSNDVWLAWKIYNTSPADVSIDMDDEGNGNGLQTCYIQMA